MSESVKDTMDGVEWNVPGKELDQILRKFVVKRLWEEDLQRYNDLREELL
jgi:hypothetical protein